MSGLEDTNNKTPWSNFNILLLHSKREKKTTPSSSSVEESDEILNTLKYYYKGYKNNTLTKNDKINVLNLHICRIKDKLADDAGSGEDASEINDDLVFIPNPEKMIEYINLGWYISTFINANK
jgi:hypothetical protein